MRVTLGVLANLMLLLADPAAAARDYDVVYVRQPRYGDATNTTWPEVFHPASLDPGADLMLLHPDGNEEVLVAGGNGSVTDPFVSFDGRSVYYAYFPDLRPNAINGQRGLPYEGADIYRIDVATRAITRLTHGEFSPNTGAGRWYEPDPQNPPDVYAYDHLGYGILNLAPTPVPGGRIVFSSNRYGYEPPKGFTNPTLQLFVMDEDGRNVRAIAPMSISSALHPTILRDGRVMFSSHEGQGLRDVRLWGIWSIQPDGRNWKPVVSAFRDGQAFHFMTQLSGGDLVLVDYYNLNNNGFGALYRMPTAPPPGVPAFHSAFAQDNPSIARTIGMGIRYDFTMPFTPYGLHSITPFTHGDDEAAPKPNPNASDAQRVGKFTHPSGAPSGDLLVVWTPGPANDLTRPVTQPYYDAGLYLVAGTNPVIDSPAELELVKNSPQYNEAWPRALVSYRRVHGIDAPEALPFLPNDGSVHAALPRGTPHGLVGTSSFYKRESKPGWVPSWSNTFEGLDAFNTGENGQSSNWGTQGADAGKYSNSDIWAVRVVAMEPHSHRSYGPNGGRHFENHASERLRILGEIPLRKTGTGGAPVLDPEGNPDTSFLAKIVADTPFTFQTLDRNGMVLNMAQTWHQVRPGELRADCGGCHAHSQQPLAFEQTAAAQPGYPIHDLSKVTPLLTRPDPGADPSLRIENVPVVDVEFLADIRPILQAKCVSCHAGGTAAPGNLDLANLGPVAGLPGDYYRLAADSEARYGHPPVIGNRTWRQTNASRYVRMFQSRRSLLVWKIFGQRLDGWTNADHPTETVPGNAGTLPAGANANEADLDYTGAIMPPPPALPLTSEEKLAIVRWIDLGAPIDVGDPRYGWGLDDLRPTLAVEAPRAGANMQPVPRIVFGMADANSGIDVATLSVTADVAIAGRLPGAELRDLAVAIADGIYAVDVGTPLAQVAAATLRVSVRDRQGNRALAEVAFSVPVTADTLLRDGFE